MIHALTGQYLSLAHDIGKTHDFKIFKKNGLGLSHGVYACFADKGCQGLKDYLPDSLVFLPFKRSKLIALNELKRHFNRLMSRRRITVEHAIRGVKRFGILRDRYRGLHCRFSVRFALIAGLYNYELMKKLLMK